MYCTLKPWLDTSAKNYAFFLRKNNAIKTCYSGKSWTSKDNFTCTSYNKNNLISMFLSFCTLQKYKLDLMETITHCQCRIRGFEVMNFRVFNPRTLCIIIIITSRPRNLFICKLQTLQPLRPWVLKPQKQAVHLHWLVWRPMKKWGKN